MSNKYKPATTANKRNLTAQSEIFLVFKKQMNTASPSNPDQQTEYIAKYHSPHPKCVTRYTQYVTEFQYEQSEANSKSSDQTLTRESGIPYGAA